MERHQAVEFCCTPGWLILLGFAQCLKWVGWCPEARDLSQLLEVACMRSCKKQPAQLHIRILPAYLLAASEPVAVATNLHDIRICLVLPMC